MPKISNKKGPVLKNQAPWFKKAKNIRKARLIGEALILVPALLFNKRVRLIREAPLVVAAKLLFRAQPIWAARQWNPTRKMPTLSNQEKVLRNGLSACAN